MNHNNEPSFYDISQALMQLGRHMTLEAVDKITHNFSFDEERKDGLLMLASMSMAGEIDAVAYMLKKNVNPNLESWEYHYHRGPALLFALFNNRSSTSIKVEMIKTLVDGGADINAEVQWFDREKGETKVISLIACALIIAQKQVMVMNDTNFDTASRKDARNEAIGLHAMLMVLIEAGAKITQEQKNRFDELFYQISKPKKKKISATALTAKGLQILHDASEPYALAEAARKVCYELLEDEALMPTQAWADMVRHLAEISLTFEQVSEEVYGESVAFDEDEGWLCQGWEQYVWLGELIELLSHESALKNPEWEILVLLILNKCEQCDTEIDDAIENLLETPWVQKHPAYRKLQDLAGY